MDHLALAERMGRFPAALEALLEGIDGERLLARPDDKTWSILEVVCHLVDEEIGDFGPRLFSTLDSPTRAWDPFDPEALARDGDYRSRNIVTELGRFAELRSESVRVIRAIESPDWDRAYNHPRFGSISAGELMTAWSAHDALHLRQIAKRLLELAASDGGYSHRYAGDW